jgi:hypothetical protein
MKTLKNIIRRWLPIGLIIIMLSGLAYLLAQQILRQNANDPQVQMAEDAAALLSNEKNESLPIPDEMIDYGKSLAPFLIVFDDAGNVVGSSGKLNDIIEVPPAGVLDYVREHGEDRVTWQPSPTTRVAAVIVRVEGVHPGFVLAGRSLREVEERSNMLLSLVLLGLIVMLATSLILVVALELIFSRHKVKIVEKVKH